MMWNNSVDDIWLGSMMIEGTLGLCVGVLLGLFYFAGLWWTVSRLSSTERVAMLFVVSLLLRMAIVILGFYFILGDSWQKLILGLVGFMLVRFVATRYVGLKQPSYDETKAAAELKQKDNYAP